MVSGLFLKLLLLQIAITTAARETCPHPLSIDYDILHLDVGNPLHQNLTILNCAAGLPAYRAQSSFLLSLHYLQKSNLIGGYHYAVRLLEIEPFDCRGHLLMSKIYSSLKSSHRASLYHEIALSLDPLCTIHSHLVTPLFLLPSSPDHGPPLQDPYLLAIINTINQLTDQSLYTLFLSLQRTYPNLISDSSVYSLELFLNQFERLFPLSSSSSFSFSSPSAFIPFIIPTLATYLNLSHEWPLEHLVYIFNWSLVQNIFGETVLGLFDAITRLSIPTGITSSTHHLTPDDVIIKPVGGPYSTRIDIHYVIWNFEKNPNVAQEDDQENSGFIIDACGREESAYEYQYFTFSTTYWESIPTSMAKWKVIQPKLKSILQKIGIDNGPPHLVPTFLPLTIIQFSLLKANFQRIDLDR
jgi:hypothetical protein